MGGNFFKRFFCLVTLAAFIGSSVTPAYSQSIQALPEPGVRVGLSASLNPPVLKGIKVFCNEPFRFDFILDKGDSKESAVVLKAESTRLIKYFLASLTVPEKDLWVNLSPFEKDHIVPEAFGQTEMGRDLLSQDYLLKQITASLIYPEGEIGEIFWKKVYEKAYERYGTTDMPVDTFNKVWIVPEKAVVYESKDSAYVVESRLKVMLETDYLATLTNAMPTTQPMNVKAPQVLTLTPNNPNDPNDIAKDILREIVIPILEKEVNEGKNFAQLRQVYHSIILAAWYKKKIKESLLDKVYVDQKKVAGVNVDNPEISKEIWAQYVRAFKKGAYNYIKEEVDPETQETIPRKYFSGGTEFTDTTMASALQFKNINSSGAVQNVTRTNNESFVTISSVVSPLGVRAENLPLATDVRNNQSSALPSHIQSKTRLARILRVLAESEGDVLGGYTSSTQVIERLVARLKERGLVKETIDDEDNVIVEIEPVENDRLYQALSKWVFNPSNGPGVKAVNFKSDVGGEFSGRWVIIGLASELGKQTVIEHERLEVRFRRENPEKSWVWAHNNVVSETGEGEQVDEGVALAENMSDADFGTGLFDFLRRTPDKVLTSGSIRSLENTGARIIDTDMTLDYGGLKKWNLDRIFIDLVQNHKPADAQGSRLFVRINLKDGRALDIADPDLMSVAHDAVVSIEIGDDGIGYDYEHLKYFLTTKGSSEQGGKFGEGLKIATAAALSQGMTLEFRSRSWIGTPLLQEKVLNEGHPNEIKTKNVVLAVRENGTLKGSRTIIHEPSADFFAVVKRGLRLVLDLRKDYRAAAKLDGVGEIVGESVNGISVIYVKRNKILSMPDRKETFYPSMFDFNFFEDEALNRDRDTLPSYVISKTVFAIILKVATPNMIKQMIQGVILPDMDDSNQIGQFYENKAYFNDDLIKAMSQADKERWQKVFYEIFGADAVIGSMKNGKPDETSIKAMEKGLRVVFLSNGADSDNFVRSFR
ncbi:MAG: sensor histidine kinase [Candidatus Omnitrophica bacterium]|nr:sensor histidine kinase [Candidatus Omnitrophota bacterium]